MEKDLTKGPVTLNILLFALPLMFGNLLQQFYNIADTYIVGKYLGSNALAAVGSSYTLMTFLTSILIGLCMGASAVISIQYVAGAAIATSFSQYISGIGIMLYTLLKEKNLIPDKKEMKWDKNNLSTILNLSLMTSIQQSVMNLGILMVQGLVNSFGTQVMAAFAAAVKIDSFAYMPVQDFGNAFSTYVAQNHGANRQDRIKKGIHSAITTSVIFSCVISLLVYVYAKPLLEIFINPSEVEIIKIGISYLHIEGSFYFGIGILFLLYGYYRAINKPSMSLILTIASLGTRVVLAYILSSTTLGTNGIWMSVPIGWFLADTIGIVYYFLSSKKTQQSY